MNVCVFVGPTLAVADARAVLDALYLPPAKHGDVYRAVASLRPQAIALIDGYFQWSAAVWHKEILWAMHEGVHVFGASSIGALRAAELAPFGMRGVGRIFEAYRAGVFGPSGDEAFEDDDEVCVVHGPPESGYVAASEALVNIRRTLADAVDTGVISDGTRLRLVAIAKAAFFPDRSFAQLLRRGRSENLAPGELAALERWLPAGQVNQKRQDALAMLEVMREFLAAKPPPARAGFSFERTTLWERAVSALQPAATLDPAAAAVLDELRLDAARWASMWREARDALLGTDSLAPEAEIAARVVELEAPAGTGAERLEQAARREAEHRLGAQLPEALLERKVLALVRAQGHCEGLRERAMDKERCLASLRLPDVEEFSELQLLELRDWYFSQLLQQEMPDDLEGWIRDLGYRDLARFHRALFAEYVYLEHRRSKDAVVDATRLTM
jgi:hypothetical protein